MTRAGHPDERPVAHGGARRRDLLGPPRLQQLVGLDAAREAADQHGAVLDAGPLQQHLAGVRVGRSRLGVEVVAVVPDDDQAEVVDRGEGGGPRPDHDPAGATTHQQELAVARAGAGLGLQRDVLVGTEHLEQSGVDAGHVAVVGHADDGAPATGQGGGGQLRQQPRPVLPRRRVPDGTRSAAGAQVPEERRGRGIGGPVVLRYVEASRARGRAARAASPPWRGGAAPRGVVRRSSRLRSARRSGRRARRSAGVSTGSAPTARRSGASRPSCSLALTRSTTKPSTSCPANRTFTRTPGTACSAIDAGTA